MTQIEKGRLAVIVPIWMEQGIEGPTLWPRGIAGVLLWPVAWFFIDLFNLIFRWNKDDACPVRPVSTR